MAFKTKFLFFYSAVFWLASCQKTYSLKFTKDHSAEEESTPYAPVSNLAKSQLPALIRARALEKIPQTAQRPAVSLSKKEIANIIGENEISVFRPFFNTGYNGIRACTTLGPQELRQKRFDPCTIALYQARAQSISAKLKMLPPSPGVVFRGIRDVSLAQIETLTSHWQSGTPIGLGPNLRPALTSATWDHKVAKHFFGENSCAYRVFFVIHHQSGVVLENLSPMPGEHEVLLPASSFFTIRSIAMAEGVDRGLVVHLQEYQK